MTQPIVPADGFTHVRIIVGMVLGLSVARLVNGMTLFVQHPGQTRIYPIHLGWAVFVLISIVHVWWFEFYLSQIATWRFFIYLFVIVYAMTYVALAALLFPDRMSEYAGYEDYFESRKRWFYGLLALSCVLDLGDTMIKGGDYFAGLGPEYLYRQAAFIVAAVAAMFIPGKPYQALFLAVGMAYEISWIFRMYNVLV
jgi:hypothetical protein